MTSTFPLAISIFTERERSFERRATRLTAFVSLSRSNSIFLSFSLESRARTLETARRSSARSTFGRRRRRINGSLRVQRARHRPLQRVVFRVQKIVFFGRMTPTSSVIPASYITSTSARRCPSVATIARLSGLSTNFAPFRKKRVSSPVIANCVFATSSLKRCAEASRALYHLHQEPSGNPRAVMSAFASQIDPPPLLRHLYLRLFERPFQEVPSGSRRVFFAGSVSEPLLLTDAWQRLRSATSRSVASIFTSFSAGLDQDVGQDRNCVFSFHYSLEKVQFSQKVIFTDNEFHTRVVTSGGVVSQLQRILFEEEKKR